jgi:GNAT superfamily N-acetyltransferase
MYVIRNAEQNDMDFIIKLAAEQGWNPGLHDGECFFNADPQGFFIGELSGERIGCISAVSYGSFGFIGLYIVKEEYRKKGYGIALWERAMNRLEGCNIGLDGVVVQQENYKKSGFVLAHRNLRYEGIIRTDLPSVPYIVTAEEVPLDAIADYDAHHFPADRKAFLACWVSMPDAKSLVYHKNGDIYGYGTIRKCQCGYKIGPLFADTYEIAEQLFLNLAGFAGQEPVYLDISDTNDGALALCRQYHMAQKFETARMYTGETPRVNWNNVYGITTFELG